MFGIIDCILILFAVIGFLGKNIAVTYSMLFLIFVKQTPLNQYFPYIEKYGLNLGIIILTIGVMAPMASGKISSDLIISSLLGWKSLIAVFVGILVSWIGGQGLSLMQIKPDIVAGLLVGTIIGIGMFKGVPVGPIIAAGIVSLVYKVV